MACHSASAEPEGEGPSVPLPLSEDLDNSSSANFLPSTPSPRRDTEPFPLLEDSSLEDPFIAPPSTPPQAPNWPSAPQQVPFAPPTPLFFGPVVYNYPAANNIMTAHNAPIPRGTPGRVQQLHNLMHGTTGGAPIMGSDGRWHDPNTSAHLDYGIEDTDIRQLTYAAGGAPVAQAPSHPQAALGHFMGVQEELADIIPGQAADQRAYGFHADQRPPFVNLVAQVFPNTNPVIRIENIPFGVSYGEIVLHMEKYLMPHLDEVSRNYPIHILMERSTGKSQDAWLELPDQYVMDACMGRYDSLCLAGKQPKMGGRTVDVFAATQGELMKALFPHAKDIYWDPNTGIPILVKPDFSDGGDDPYSQGFRGFLTKEELYCARTHAEHPGRAPFPQRSLQRCYEAMMATIIKYPWASPYFKTSERDELFETYLSMLSTLAKKVHDTDYINANGRVVGLTDRLCTNFVNIALRCPGFSERQKARIADMVDEYNIDVPLSKFSSVWPFITLAIPAEVIDDDLYRWMELFDLGCKVTEDNITTLAASVEGIVDLGRDPDGFWLMQDLTFRAERRGVPGAIEYGHADLAVAEEKLMKALIQRGWEQFFHNRGMALPAGVAPFESAPTTIQNKMDRLGVYKPEGIDRPKGRKAGDDIIFIPKEQYGSWRHLLQSSTTQVPVKSLTEALAQVGLVADPRDEIQFQRIQAEIRGETPAPEPASGSGSACQLQYASPAHAVDSPTGGRPGYGMMHAQATPSFHARRYSTVTTTPRQLAFRGTPRSTVRSNYESGTFSAPQRSEVRITSPDDGSEIDFNQIAQQVIATKSVENTPQGKTVADESDPFAASASRGAGEFYDRVGRAPEPSPSLNRRRSQSPNKNSYTVTTASRAWENAPRFGTFGPVGTPPRRPQVHNTVNAAPTIQEGDEDNTWPTPSASAKGKGRYSRG